jgi:xanthine dehydrogenase accessory factor
MHYNAFISKTICEFLAQGQSCVLVSMLENTGSSPRHSGTKMLVDSEGRTFGTVGGGLMEASAIKRGIAANHSGCSSIMNFDMNNIDANSPEMICGGAVKLLIEYITPSAGNKEFFCKWYDAINRRLRFDLLNIIQFEDEYVSSVNHAMLFSDGSIAGDSAVDQRDIDYMKSGLDNIAGSGLLNDGFRCILVERSGRIKRLYCFGSGHVAVPTASLAAKVGFEVVVIDDRAEYASSERFPSAEVRVIRDFAYAFDRNEIDEDSFIAIFTREHRYDRLVLEQALRTKAAYIGLMASKKKRNTIYAALKEKGFTDADLARVHSPIGIKIEAETSEELAVSIVSELIYERAAVR